MAAGDEILNCRSFLENEMEVTYDWFYSYLFEQQISVAKTMIRKFSGIDADNEEQETIFFRII